eukprot:1392051-Amorphochlora_amoeboformis.AAC.1
MYTSCSSRVSYYRSLPGATVNYSNSLPYFSMSTVKLRQTELGLHQHFWGPVVIILLIPFIIPFLRRGEREG